MGFIDRELQRLNAEIARKEDGPVRDTLYAAQQALAWAQEPNGFESPYELLTRGTQEGSEGYLAAPHPSSS